MADNNPPPGGSGQNGGVDLDTLPPMLGKETPSPPSEGDIYDATEDREKKRGQIALTLIWLLVGVVAGGFILVLGKVVCLGFSNVYSCSALNVVEIRPLVEMFLTPIVGLVGAVTGFYFGGKKG